MTVHEYKPGWERDPTEIRRSIVREMNRLGAYTLKGQYSGGHDEGGLEDLVIYDKKGAEIPIEGRYDHPLWSAIDDLLSTKFYTWALGCSVYGHVYVDLKAKRAWTEGEMEETHYVSDSDPIEISW